MNKYLARLSQKARELTHSPGVYIMKDKSNEIIYIGKAKNLKNRVSSYFQPNNPSHTEKVKRMVNLVYDFDYIMVDSEFEALVLECSLIKQHKPKYNILLKDDRGYSYIGIGKGDYPRITAEYMNNDKSKTFFGPYISSYSVKQTVYEINKIFKFPTCNRKFPQDIGKGRPCLNFHIKQCVGVCSGKISPEDYSELIKQAISYIKKDDINIVERLNAEMNEAAENLEFERAAALRDRMNAIAKISESQKIVISAESQDALAFARINNTAVAAILRFRGSKLVDKREYTFSEVYDLDQTRQEFLDQYYINEQDIPKRILIDEPFDGVDILADYLAEKKGSKVTIAVPQRGEGKKIVEMAYKNASDKVAKFINSTAKDVKALEELTRILGLEKTPEYIEAYDISNMGETAVVGGMVTYLNGRPYKKGYKKFKIKDVVGQDDYASMQEVLRRRFERYFEEKESGEGFGRLPDLILLDGGKGHVGVIKPMLASMGVSVPIFGMVKDSRHRTRAIAADGGEIAISGTKSVFALVTNIQDEVHRYSINYQKTAHKKAELEITLTRVDGIGEKKAAMILREFKTKTKIKEATVEELMKAAKINEATARQLHDFIAECY